MVILALSERFGARVALFGQFGIDGRGHYDPVGLQELVEQARLEKKDR